MKIDLRFHVMGETLDVDHGYFLFCAVSKVLPFFHDANNVGMSTVRGKYIGDGLLRIAPFSSLAFRLPVNEVAAYINLAGRTIEVGGQTLKIGVPSSHSLVPATALYAHLVTTRNGQDSYRFEQEIKRQLNSLGCDGNIVIGKRRTFGVHGRQIVGYSVLVSELQAEESITLQENGLGGRRKMGCGFFLPWKG